MNMEWTREQKHIVVACFLGWMLDAFDFFLMVFILHDIAKEFVTPISSVALALTLTLAMRPVGAVIFGRISDKYGRRPAMMWCVALYSFLEFLSGFSPNLLILLILRSLFGIAMGGEWGVGAALTMESIPAKSRGFISGILQAGYPVGYLLASIVFGLFHDSVGWRGMFFIGVLPALLVLYIRSKVIESPAIQQAKQSAPKANLVVSLKQHWKLAIYVILLMTAFNFFSHGTQDMYPTFLEVQHHFNTHTVSIIAIIANLGAIAGAFIFGALSQRIGRRRAIALAAVLSLPILPLWAYSSTMLMLAVGGFLMQVMVQGAWGVVPVHLNELSPPEIRGTFPGVTYQLGNLLAAANATIQAGVAQHYGGNYSLSLVLIAGIFAVVIVVLALLGRENHSIAMVEQYSAP
jgi:SHS family lactate transporter-like MFS transporter